MFTPNIKKRYLAIAILSLLLAVPQGGRAQLGSIFGKNKVQYRDFGWSVLSTEHFDTYFYQEERPLAYRTARMAERSYSILSEALDHEISGQIPLILYTSHNDFQQTNTVGGIIPEGVQGITESLKHRVILPFTGSYAEFNHVLTHELVHAFQFDVMSGSERRMNPLQREVPLWFMEGMAEYLSVGMDRGTEVWIRDALENEGLVSVSELNMLSDIRVYRFGQALWYFIGETYGQRVVGELLRKAFFFGSTARAFLEVLGLDEKELTAEWHQWVRDNFQVPAGFVQPDGVSRRVTSHTGYYYNLNLIPALSPEGNRLAFLSNSSLYNDIVLKDLESKGGEEVLVHGGRSGSFESLRFLDTQLSWSFDGRYLALVGESTGRETIYIVDADRGKIVKKLTPGLDGVVAPSWSPRGDQLVFTGIHEGQSDLYVINLDGSGLDRLTDDIYSDLQPRWSPDGNFIAFATDRGSDTDIHRLIFGGLEIALYEVPTGRIEILTDITEDCHNPQWSPDGRSIAFISPIGGPPNIFAVDVESCELVRLTSLVTGVGGLTPTSPAISWSSDTGTFAFSSFSRNGWDIFVLESPATDSSSILDEADRTWSRTDYGSYPVPDQFGDGDKRYRARFAPDVLIGGVGYSNNVGVAGQSYILVSDMLGNQNFVIATNIYGSLSESELLFSYINLTHRTNYALTAFQYRNDFGLFTAPDSAEFLSQIFRGAGITLSRPFDTFTRLEYGANAMLIEEKVTRQSFLTGGETTVADTSGLDFCVNPMVALVQDNSLFGATGPIAGHRFRLQAEGGLGNIRFTTLTGDLRIYFNFARRYTLAYWLVGGGSFGDNAQIFRIGGPYTFRGADYGELDGSRVVMQNIEFRFPILFMLPPTLDFFKGAVFWDMAAAWDNNFQPFTTEGTDFFRLKDLQGAYGAGARVGFGYFAVRFDVAQRTDLRGNIGKTRGFFSIGGDF